MANRILRDWTNSEKIDNLSLFTEVFFTRLIMKADDYGIFYGNPKLLKSHLFPLKETATELINGAIDELVKNNIITTYIAEGRTYLKISDFNQRLRQMSSKYPQPADSCQSIDSSSPPETKRNEVETKRNETINEIPEILKPLIQDIGKFFQISEINQFRHYQDITDFVTCLNHNNRIEYFKTQWTGYKEAKSGDNAKYRHTLTKFLGTGKELFEDGKWNERNWKLNGQQEFKAKRLN